MPDPLGPARTVPGADVADRPGSPAPLRAAARAAVDDLQGESADLGWSEASSLADALVDGISHLLVDLAHGAETPTARPAVVGAIGGQSRPLDHASCRATAASLRRAAAVLAQGTATWTGPAAEVTLELADLLDHCADQARSSRMGPSTKGVVLRKLSGLARVLHELPGPTRLQV